MLTEAQVRLEYYIIKPDICTNNTHPACQFAVEGLVLLASASVSD